MLSSQSIWATNILFLNDENEFEHFIKVIIDAIGSKYPYLGDGNKDQWKEEWYFAISDSILDLEKDQYHVACFSEFGDSLGQWRGYCPPGIGYCVGFEKNELETIANNPSGVLHKCKYQLSVHQDNANELLDTLLSQLWEKYPLGIYLDNITKLVKENWGDFSEAIISQACTTKDSAFTDENEWRIVISENKSDLKFRLGHSNIVPYTELKFNTGTFPIKQVIIGPTPNMKLARLAIQKIIEKNEWEIEIKESSVPYRSW